MQRTAFFAFLLLVSCRSPEGSLASPDEVVRPATLSEKSFGELPAVEDGSRIDVLFLYTRSALAATGGLPGLEAKAYANESFFNIALRESLPAVRPALRINIVGFAELPDSTPLGQENQAVDADVMALRNRFSADIAVVVHHRYKKGAGIATVFCGDSKWSSTYGYVAQIQAGSMMFYMAPAHEIGHLLGAGHDYKHRGVACLHKDSRGWSFEAADRSGKMVLYGTLMDYKGDVRLPRFSNPNVSYLGVPTGKAGEADNARAVDEARIAVANYIPVSSPYRDAPGGPAIAVTSPADGASVAAGGVVTITADVTDSEGVADVHLLWDTGDALGCPAAPRTGWSCTRNGSSYAWKISVDAGERLFRIRATDRAGRRSVTDSRTLVSN